MNLINAPISVIIPCYRGEKTLERALSSICRQTLPPSEVIVVDDGSPRDSAEKIKSICSRHQRNYPFRLSLHTLPFQAGPGHARNKGWEKSVCAYIAFLDADDSWHPQKLETQYSWMAENPKVVLTCHKSVVFRNDTDVHFKPIGRYIREKKIRPMVQLLSNRIHTRTAMVKKEIPFRFAENRKYSEDYQLWLEIILNGFSAYELSAELAYTYKHQYGANGLSGDLKKMEIGELSSYGYLYRHKLISSPLFMGLCLFSLSKFCIRSIHTFLRKKALHA